MTVLHTVQLCTIIFVLSCFVALSNLWYFFFLGEKFFVLRVCHVLLLSKYHSFSFSS